MLESSIFKLEWITFLVFWRMFTFKTETPCSSLSNRRNRSNRQAENCLYRWHATVVHFHLKSAMCWWFGYIDNSFHGIPVSNTRVWIHTDVSVVRSNSFSHFILSVSLSFRSDSDSIHNRFSVYIYEWAENETGIQTHSTTLLVACSTLFIRFALASSCIKMLLLLLWLFVTYFLRSICSTIHSVGLLPFCYPWNEYIHIYIVYPSVGFALMCSGTRVSVVCTRDIYTCTHPNLYIHMHDEHWLQFRFLVLIHCLYLKSVEIERLTSAQVLLFYTRKQSV